MCPAQCASIYSFWGILAFSFLFIRETESSGGFFGSEHNCVKVRIVQGSTSTLDKLKAIVVLSSTLWGWSISSEEESVSATNCCFATGVTLFLHEEKFKVHVV